MVWPDGAQKIGVMTSGLVDGVIITGPPWKISGGVPLAGSLFLIAALAAQGPPIGRTMPTMWPIRGCGEHAFGGGGAALAAMGVTIASMLPAIRVRAAPRPIRLCAFFILPPVEVAIKAVCRYAPRTKSRRTYAFPLTQTSRIKTPN